MLAKLLPIVLRNSGGSDIGKYLCHRRKCGIVSFEVRIFLEKFLKQFLTEFISINHTDSPPFMDNYTTEAG